MASPISDLVVTAAGRSTRPTASVVISTRDRPESLGVALESLVNDGSTTPTEIIVVDNGSTPGTQSVVVDVASRSPWPIVLIREPRPGLSRARNTGVGASRGQFILFTDDDVEVGHGWIDAMVSAFEPSVVAVGGRITPLFLGECPSWLKGYPAPMTLEDYGQQPFDMAMGRLPIGANMAFEAQSLRSRLPEPFDPRLGHNGRVGIGGEETHLLRQLLTNYRVVYAPTAHVYHRIEASRCVYPAVRKSFYQLGFGTARMQRLGGEALPTYPRRVVRLFRCLRGAIAIAIRNTLRSDIDPQSAKQEFWAFLWLGLHVEHLFGANQALSEWFARVFPTARSAHKVTRAA
jgi:glycosyltransferase involved in cell wall biosynthesis